MNRKTALILGLSVAGGAAATAATVLWTRGRDGLFIADAALGGKLEIELGHLAQQKAESPEVKDFGERMIIDHGSANRELIAIAENLGKTVPSEYKMKQKAMLEKLSSLQGAEFDRAYMEKMTMIHGKDVELFSIAPNKLKNLEVKAWAEKTLLVLEKHLRIAKSIALNLGVDADSAEKSGIKEADRTLRYKFAA